MRSAPIFMFTIIFSACAFDASNLDQKIHCISDSDCLPDYFCYENTCRSEFDEPEDVSPSKADSSQEENDSQAEQCTDEICDGKDNDCDGQIDEDFQIGRVCSEGLGICQSFGYFYCASENYSACSTEPLEFLKSQEICDGFDNDCNGMIDENLIDCCEPNSVKECGSNVGECQAGIKICQFDRTWSECQEDKGPSIELCDNKDNDCDGSTDEEIDYCCQQGEMKVCGQSDVGECETFDQTCGSDLRWTLCQAIYPQAEICDNKDNDCDGETDEGSLCPDNFICHQGACQAEFDCQTQQLNGHYYALCLQPKNWHEANALCQQYGGHLVSINSRNENALLRDNFDFVSAWLGINDQTIEGRWTWSNGEPVVYVNWIDGEPNNHGTDGVENCGEIRQDRVPAGGWNDATCGTIQPFFCESNEPF